jgi:predicted nucleic acid-binding protein
VSYFYDTNTLIYLVSNEPAKTRRVIDLMAQGGWISVQVLNEATRVLRNKLRYDWASIDNFLIEIRESLLETHELGLALAKRHRLAVFDSMIVAAALIQGCDTLYSEDMHHGLLVEGQLRVTNPFRE